MGYRRALSFGWARRDSLAVVVIALTVSFLVGAAVLGVALGDQTTEIAAEFETSYEIVGGEGAGHNDGAATIIHLTLAETTVDDQQVTVVGVPPNAPDLTVRGETITFRPSEGGALAATSVGGSVSQIDTTDGKTVAVVPRESHPLFPESWFVTDPDTAAGFEDATQITIQSTDTRASTPLLSALEFFVRGSAELVRLLRFATLAAGVLVAVTIYSVVRITIRERRPDIAVLRSTGATPRQILRLFVIRALVLTAVGAAVGYGLGLILVRTVVNAAIYAGLPTSLSAQITQPVVSVLVPALLFFLSVGGLSGLLAAYAGATRDPHRLANPTRSGLEVRTRNLGRLIETRLIGWDALVPTTATLTVFMCVLLLLTGIVGTAGPLSNADEQTITQPDAPHPIASTVPVVYAETLRSQGGEASPEILLFEVYEGEPIVARGVNFSAYQQFSGIEISQGTPPQQHHEALVGDDLARSTGLSAGETIIIGGSTDASLMRLKITGTFAGTGIQDDQLLVSLPAARELGNVRADSVHLVRTRGIDSNAGETSTIVTTDASLTTKDGRTGVSVAATNLGLSEETRDIDVTVDGNTKTTSVTLESRRSTRVFVPFENLSEGSHTLVVDDIQKNVTTSTDAGQTRGAGSRGELSITAPRTVPLHSTPQIRVSRGETPVANATVRLDTQTVQTDNRGNARVSFNSTGEATLVAETDRQRATMTVTVAEEATRAPILDVAVSPDAPSIFTRPEAATTVTNPWAQKMETRVTIAGPNIEEHRTRTLESGEATTIHTRIPQRPAGTYTVTATTTGGERAAATYTVQGDERLGAALAQSGRYSGGGGITQAIQVVFGNIEVLVLAIVTLLSVMTIGSTTAAFTRAVHTTKHEIGIRRATGADPRTILTDVFVDTLKIGMTATVFAMGLAIGLVQVLLELGELRVFGLVLEPVLTLTVVGGALAGGLTLAVISALLATASVVRASPASLLVDRHIPMPSGNDE